MTRGLGDLTRFSVCRKRKGAKAVTSVAGHISQTTLNPLNIYPTPPSKDPALLTSHFRKKRYMNNPERNCLDMTRKEKPFARGKTMMKNRVRG